MDELYLALSAILKYRIREKQTTEDKSTKYKNKNNKHTEREREREREEQTRVGAKSVTLQRGSARRLSGLGMRRN